MFGIFGKQHRERPVPTGAKAKEYGIGVALGGGGAKGAAHCGALQAMHEYGIDPDIVAGTSAGSIVGALHAAGVKPAEMCGLFMHMDFKDLLSLRMPKTGFFDQTPLLNLLHRIIPAQTFADLSKPLLVAACNLDEGRTEIFDHGELAPRVMASCSIPVLFQPTVIDGMNYVDGGVFMNLPVSPLKEKCEKVIGISVHASIAREYKKNLLGVAMRSFYLMFVSNTLDEAKKCDIYIDINTMDYSPYDLSNIERLFFTGYLTTVKALEENGYTRQRPREEITFPHKTAPKPHTEER